MGKICQFLHQNANCYNDLPVWALGYWYVWNYSTAQGVLCQMKVFTAKTKLKKTKIGPDLKVYRTAYKCLVKFL